MNRKFGTGVLILCFGFSTINIGWANEAMGISPVMVQPEIQELNQQMIDRDRQNRDEEIAIKRLVEDNDRLTQATLARQQDEGLVKINQTMLGYRDTLLSRDRARIAANGERRWTSRYGDLIALTEDADAMTVHRDLENKSGLLTEKYQMLTALKDEMMALNEKLTNGQQNGVDQKKSTIDGFEKIAQEQQDRIQMLTQKLSEMDKRIAQYDEIIAEKDRQIAQLKENLSMAQRQSANPSLAAKDEIIKEKQGQLDLLKSELEDKIVPGNSQGPKDEIIKQQEDQIAMLKVQSQELSSKEEMVKAQADQIAKASEQFKDNSAVYADIKAQVLALRNVIHQQDIDLKAKNDSIRWLHQVLAVAKNKGEYYRLSSQINQLPVKRMQEEVQNIKDDFARHFKDYDQFENAVISLKVQVSQLGLQLSKKQGQVNLLKSELENKITEAKDQKIQIIKMKADIQAILQAQANKEIYRRNAKAQVDDRIKLAQQLIDLQWQETALLDEKSNLEAAQSTLFDQHALAIENKIKELLAKHQIQTMDLESRMQELKNELYQKEQEINSLQETLKNKIAEEKNQAVLADQIQDLKAQLQDKEDQIATMKTQLQEGQKTQDEADSLKQQLAAEQDKADQLKQQLDNKTAQSDQTTMMMGDYQKKLESRNNAYNEQLAQVTALNVQLQEKEAQIVKIKKDMYDLQELANTKETDSQAKDLSLSMVQQKMMDAKINEYQDKINELQATNVKQVQEVTRLRTDLALARQELQGMPSSDEIDFLRSGLKKATLQLKQKTDTLLQVKANADEYVKEFKEQTLEFQSLKEQLLDAQEKIQRKDEDLKYKDMALTRLKDLSRTSESDLKIQVKELMSKTHENKVEVLQVQLKRANLKIKDLQTQLNQLKSSSGNDAMEEKLKQALDKIDEQGRMITVLAQKLQDAGQSVDLTKDTGSK